MLTLTALAGGNTGSKLSAAKLAADQTNALSSESVVVQSNFLLPTNNKEGKDPFFPKSLRPYVSATPTPNKTVTPLTEFVLKALTPQGNPPTAMINNRVLAAGEEGEIKLPSGGKALIHLLEIKDESAVIDVMGQRIELRFKRGV